MSLDEQIVHYTSLNEEIAADSAMQVYTRPFVEATEPRGAQPLLKV